MAEIRFLSLLRNPKIPLKLRRKLKKISGLPAAGIKFQIKLFDALFEGETGTFLDDKIYLFGSHESSTLHLMHDILDFQKKEGIDPVYLDIGTNTGQHLVAVAGRVKRAYGFEPWEKVRQIAERNCTLNQFHHVKILPFGLGAEEAILSYAPPPGNNLGTGSFLAGLQNQASFPLPIRIGDAVMQELQITPTLVKIDTEGFELDVLVGLRQTLELCRPVIIFEFNELGKDRFGSLEKIFSFFPKDYSFYGIARSRQYPKLVPFDLKKKFENVLAWPENNLLLKSFRQTF